MPAHLELTDERLVVRIGDEAVPRYDVPFHRITDVEVQVGLLTGFLTVHMGEEKLAFSRIPKAAGPADGRRAAHPGRARRARARRAARRRATPRRRSRSSSGSAASATRA